MGGKLFVITGIFCSSILIAQQVYSDRYVAHYRHSIKKYSRKFYGKIAGGIAFYDKFKEKCGSSICAYVDRPKNSFSTFIAVGYDFHRNISAEIMGRFSPFKWKYNFDGDSNLQKMKIYSVFANIYFKHPLNRYITPYFTLGSGYTFNKSGTLRGTGEGEISNWSSSGRDINSVIYNIGVGSMFKLKDNFLIDIAYRYMYLGKIGFKQGNTLVEGETRKLKTHDISIGLTYKFFTKKRRKNARTRT